MLSKVKKSDNTEALNRVDLLISVDFPRFRIFFWRNKSWREIEIDGPLPDFHFIPIKYLKEDNPRGSADVNPALTPYSQQQGVFLETLWD
ncbi:unnamed protein product [Lactuca virosa]|uniref:Uncharacterized protein n=1 Tax=Lactuca virosa TaxID=75947 RepID=A0AAU9NCD2_9ASTR|nr:unnamed protein product [Lactuca virosa]